MKFEDIVRLWGFLVMVVWLTSVPLYVKGGLEIGSGKLDEFRIDVVETTRFSQTPFN